MDSVIDQLLLRVALGDFEQELETTDAGFLRCVLCELPDLVVADRVQELMPVVCQSLSTPVIYVKVAGVHCGQNAALGQNADVVRNLHLSVVVKAEFLPPKRVLVTFEREKDVT